MDIRHEKKGFIKSRPNHGIEPDIVADYRDMPFKDKSFKLVVWDIPHILGTHITGILMQRYGYLNKETYRQDIRTGFKEIMRILDDYGVLVFKYSDTNVPVNEVLDLFPTKPLFGTISKRSANRTYWFCFMRIPEKVVHIPDDSGRRFRSKPATDSD